MTPAQQLTALINKYDPKIASSVLRACRSSVVPSALPIAVSPSFSENWNIAE